MITFEFFRILKVKRTEKQNTAIKLMNGLQKINDTSCKINDMTIELEKVTELITSNTKECEKVFLIVSNRTKEIDEQKKEIDKMSTKIKGDELKCHELYDIALTELKLTIPALEEAAHVIN